MILKINYEKIIRAIGEYLNYEKSIWNLVNFVYLPVCDLISSKNFSWICIDMEHSTISHEQMSTMIDIIQKIEKCFVRLSKTDDEVLSKIALDCGADGLIFPKIETVEQARKAVELSFYPPIGKRGAALYKAQRYGNKLEEYVSNKSKKIELIFMIETKKAVDNLDIIYKKFKKTFLPQ